MAIIAACCSRVNRSRQKPGLNRAIHLGLFCLPWPCSRLCGLCAPAHGTSSLSLLFAYLDDVCLAGSLPQLRTALGRLTAGARQVGLALNPAKCKLTTTSHDGLVDPQSSPEGLTVDRSGAFTLLGAAIGNSTFCTAHTQLHRVDASKPLLEALGALDDPQTGLLLLRECASFCKVAYSARVTPPALHIAALSAFDAEVRACLETLCTGPLPSQAWAQASLSTNAGGLGLRHASRHAMAGFVASTAATEELCKGLDPHYTLSVTEVVGAFNKKFCQVTASRRQRPALWASKSYPAPSMLPPLKNWTSQGLGRGLPRKCCSSLVLVPGCALRLLKTSGCMWLLHSSDLWSAFACGCPLHQKMWLVHSATGSPTAWATTPGLALAAEIAPKGIIACAPF